VVVGLLLEGIAWCEGDIELCVRKYRTQGRLSRQGKEHQVAIAEAVRRKRHDYELTKLFIDFIVNWIGVGHGQKPNGADAKAKASPGCLWACPLRYTGCQRVLLEQMMLKRRTFAV
jgi:hypothetical protein